MKEYLVLTAIVLVMLLAAWENALLPPVLLVLGLLLAVAALARKYGLDFFGFSPPSSVDARVLDNLQEALVSRVGTSNVTRTSNRLHARCVTEIAHLPLYRLYATEFDLIWVSTAARPLGQPAPSTGPGTLVLRGVPHPFIPSLKNSLPYLPQRELYALIYKHAGSAA